MGRTESARGTAAALPELPGNLAGLDALPQADEAIAVFCFRDVRPLRGVAGFLDWRLCGGLSEPLEQGHYLGELNETMMVPTHGRLGRRRLFLFGLGSVDAWDEGRLTAAIRLAAEVVGRAGAKRVLLAPPNAGHRRDPKGRIGAVFGRAAGGVRGDLPVELAAILVDPVEG